MAQKIDPSLTQRLQDWLDTPAQDRDLISGAQMLLTLNRNRAFYNTVMRRPEKYAAKLEYEIRKFLRIRLDGMTQAKIVELEAEVIPSARQILDTSNELPSASKAKGKRPDHDRLPAHIQALWDDNLKYYHQVNLLFEELKAMNNMQPCDRYEKLQLLADADRKYRSNLAKYDDYVPGEEPTPAPAATTPTATTKKIGAARKSISKYRNRIATAGLTEEEKKSALEVLQRNVDIVISNGGGFSEETVAELTSWGITFGATDKTEE